jgi:hypothetical protein
VDVLPHVFEGVNQNFVSVAVKGVLQMVRGYTSIDFEALRQVASSCGTAGDAAADVSVVMVVGPSSRC